MSSDPFEKTVFHASQRYMIWQPSPHQRDPSHIAKGCVCCVAVVGGAHDVASLHVDLQAILG